jgi:hypothetical protein
MSDDGHLMLYATFNDTLVVELRFPWFAVQDEGKLYPEIRSLRYPKVKDCHCLSEPSYRVLVLIACKKKTLWSESASELYRPSDRRLSAK